MTIINFSKKINAPVQKIFDIYRNSDNDQNSAFGTQKKAIAVVTYLLINHNETLTCRGKHFGFLNQS